VRFLTLVAFTRRPFIIWRSDLHPVLIKRLTVYIQDDYIASRSRRFVNSSLQFLYCCNELKMRRWEDVLCPSLTSVGLRRQAQIEKEVFKTSRRGLDFECFKIEDHKEGYVTNIISNHSIAAINIFWCTKRKPEEKWWVWLVENSEIFHERLNSSISLWSEQCQVVSLPN